MAGFSPSLNPLRILPESVSTRLPSNTAEFDGGEAIVLRERVKAPRLQNLLLSPPLPSPLSSTLRLTARKRHTTDNILLDYNVDGMQQHALGGSTKWHADHGIAQCRPGICLNCKENVCLRWRCRCFLRLLSSFFLHCQSSLTQSLENAIYKECFRFPKCLGWPAIMAHHAVQRHAQGHAFGHESRRTAQ